MDGVTVTVDDNTWFNVRGSNTEPVVRLNAEAQTKSDLDSLVAKLTKLITGEEQ